MRHRSILLAVPAASLAAVLFPVPAYAIGDAPAICDVADSHASGVLGAFKAFTDVVNNGDPTDTSTAAQYQTTRADLLKKLRAEAEAIDKQDAPADYRAAVSRYSSAERAFADALDRNDLDTIQSDIDERNAAQHDLFARCNEAIGDKAKEDSPEPAGE